MKRIKKIIAVCLVFLLSFLLMDMGGYEVKAYTKYMVTDGLLTGYDGTDTKLTIPNNVIKIDNGVFKDKNITSIVIQEGVTEIGEGAFSGCINLTSVTLPNTLTSIASNAFSGCTNLTSVTIPSSVLTIGQNAFYNCTNLSTVNILNSSTVIGTNAFLGTKWINSGDGSKVNDVKLKLSKTEISFDSNGGMYENKIYVSKENSGNSGNFKVTTDVSWLGVGITEETAKTLRELTINYSAGNFYIYAQSNKSGTGEAKDRVGTITITDIESNSSSKIVVKQSGGVAKEFSSNITEIRANSKGITSIDEISINSDEGFTVINNGNNWIKLSKSYYDETGNSMLKFDESGKFYVKLDENKTTSDRVGIIRVANNSNTKILDITVTQEKAKVSISIDSSEKIIDSKGVTYNKVVNVTVTGEADFTVKTEFNDWIRVSKNMNDNFSMGMTSLTYLESGAFYVLVSENTEEKQRSGMITITNNLTEEVSYIKVIQSGAEKAYLLLTRETFESDEKENISTGINVQASDNQEYKIITKNPGRVRVSYDKNAKFKEAYVSLDAKGDSEFYIVTAKNKTTKKRYGTVIIKDDKNNLSKEIVVSQEPADVSKKDLLQELSIYAEKSTVDVGKTTRVKLGFPTGLYASDIKNIKYVSKNKKVAIIGKKGKITGKAKGKANIKVKVTLEEGYSRTVTLKITVGKKTAQK